MTTILEDRRDVIVPPPVWPHGGGDDGGDESGGGSFPITKQQIGLWVLLTAVIMFFAGLTSAYIVLRGVPAWQSIEMPSLLWLNTFVLIVSSFTIELSRGAVKKNQLAATKGWLGASCLLGLAFLAGQVAAWRQLVRAGVYLPSTLQSGFFYILTGVHGVHLLGGVVALGFVLTKSLRNRLTAFNHEPLKLCATYWHFMDALWVYLFLLLMLS